MATKKTRRPKRRYLSQEYQGIDTTLFLVYVFDPREPILKSDGPYEGYKAAQDIMIERLRLGYCSWIVSYDS